MVDGRADRTVAVGAAAAVAVLALSAAALWWQRGQEGTDRAPIGPTSVVLLGDSLTEEGDWAGLLPGWPVVNQGYSGYTSEELIPVARSVAADGPRLVLVLAGTNDIRDGRSPGWTANHLGDVLDHLVGADSEPTVVVQTLLPRDDAPAEVLAVNERIVELAEERGLTVVDLHPSFDDGSGGLRADETRDGLHLTDFGYRRWAELLEPVLATELRTP